METAQIQAYARGWQDGGNWQTPQLNPYPSDSPEWEAWAVGYDDRRIKGVKIVEWLEPYATCNNNM